MPTIDMSRFTIANDSLDVVNVATFRSQIEHLERIVRCDYSACVSDAERANCIAIAKRVGAELIGMTCKRATEEDWMRRERAIDRSTTLIMHEELSGMSATIKDVRQAAVALGDPGVVALLDFFTTTRH